MTIRTSYSYKLTDNQQKKLTRILREGNYRPLEIPHTSVAAETEKCKIALYTSGKCVIQGRNAADFVTFILEPHVLECAELGYEKIHAPENYQPHMGVDESGKGDFFGPIVIVCEYVDKKIVDRFQEMGVKDSKRITSENKVLGLGKELREMLFRQHSIVKIGPETYNRLYTRMRSVNRMLSWAHARAIENMLEMMPSCPRVVVDQFGAKHEVEQALMKAGKGIDMVQKHRAESDPAVAAASIIARETFVRSLKDMEKQYETVIPKGASAKVRETAGKLIQTHGPEILLKIAKCHFKTTDEVLETLGFTRSNLGHHGKATSKQYTR
ncbi:MAG: ribonuclease HIII [Verrucomicrobiota bacterium]